MKCQQSLCAKQRTERQTSRPQPEGGKEISLSPLSSLPALETSHYLPVLTSSTVASGQLGLQWALAIKLLAATTETQKPLGALAEGVQWYRCGHTVPAGFGATGKAPCATSLPSRDGTMQDQNQHHSKSKQLVKFWLHHSHCFQVSSLNHC